MKDQRPVPEPQVQYEGYRWLGSWWGRAGKPKPPKIGGFLMLTTAVGVFVFAIVRDKPSVAPIAAAVGVLCLIAGVFFLVEAHYAERAAREQEPFEPSVGP